MSSKYNYQFNSGGSSLGIFRKQVDLTTFLNKLKIDIFLPIGEKMEVRKLPMENALIMLGQRLLKGCILTPTRLHKLEFLMRHFLMGGTISPPLGVGINRGQQIP